MSDAYSIVVQNAAAYSLNVVSGPVVQSSFDGYYASLLGIPSTFAPSAHLHAIADVTGLQTALDSKATPAGVSAAVAALVNAAPATLDTLKELADALGSDPNFATTMTNALAGKAPLTHTHGVGDITGLGTLATQSATITDYLTIASAASTYQPLDSDLTSIAALSTTAFGRGLLTEASNSTARTTLGLGTLATVSPTGTPDGTKFLRDDNSWQVVNLSAYLPLAGGTMTGALAITQGTANTSILTSTGYSLTGANAQSLVDLAGTWNTSGTPTAFKLNVTDTASNAASLLMDLQMGGSSRVRVGKDRSFWLGAGNQYTIGIGVATYPFLTGGFNIGDSVVASRIGFQDPTNTSNGIVTIGTHSTCGLYLFHYDDGAKASRLFLDAANILAQRNSTNAQTFRIYNTFTDASNYERGQLAWESNEWRIGSAAAGTGTQRNLVLGSWNSAGTWSPGLTLTPAGTATIATSLRIGGTNISYENTRIWTSNAFQIVSVSGSNWDTELHAGYWNPTLLKYVGTLRSLKTFAFSCGEEFVWLAGNAYSSSYTGSNHIARLEQTGNFSLNQTWNNAATTFTGILANVTDTASNAASLLLDLQVGGTSRFNVSKSGVITALRFKALSQVEPYTVIDFYNNQYLARVVVGAGLTFEADVTTIRGMAGATTGVLSINGQGWLTTDAANTLAQRNSTNAQTFRLYGTFTDASNYRRLFLSSTTAGAFTLGVEGAGTGASGNTLTVGPAIFKTNDNEIYGVVKNGTSGSDTSRLFIWADGRQQARFGYASGYDGLLLGNGSYGPMIWMGGATSSFPSIKRNAAAINFRLADDSADCDITAAHGTFSAGTDTTNNPILNLSQTWNNAAVAFNANYLNITDTASATSSTLADWRVGGQEKFKVFAKGGSAVTRLELWSSYGGTPYLQWYAEAGSSSGFGGFVSCPGGFMESVTSNPGAFEYISGVASINYRQWQIVAGQRIKFGQSTTIEWYGADFRADTNTSDLVIRRDAADTLAQRRSTNAQTFRIYGTFTDASNYERGKLEWSSNVLRIGTEKAGTGSARALELQTDGTTRLTVGTTGLFTIADALNIAVGTTTGTKIGTATTQKLGFFNATPVVQPTAVADATDAASVITQLNALLSRMRNLGLIAT